jgi:hypothetical protein
MILYPADDDGLAFELGQDAAKVTMPFIPNQSVTEKRPPIEEIATRRYRARRTDTN